MKNPTTLLTTCLAGHNNTIQAEYRSRVCSDLQQEEKHKIHMNAGLVRSGNVW